MAGTDLTAMDYALKTLYPNGVEELVFKDEPFLALVPKDKNFVGRNQVIDVIYEDTQGRSANIANAQANYTSHKGIAFTITRAKDYAYGVLDRETMKATATDEGAVVNALTKEMQSATRVIRKSLGSALWGSGSGKLGQAAASGGISGSTITLSDPNDVVNFSVGQVLVLSTANGGGSVKSGTTTVKAVNRNTGVITTVNPVTTDIATAANSDYIFTQGDYDAKAKGLDAWIPASDPTSTAFFGVDRTVDILRLSGLRFDGSAMNPEEALIEAAARMAREEADPDYAFMNYLDVANLEKSLGSKKVYEDIEGPYGIGFRSIVVKGPKGDIRVVADRHATKGVCKLLTMNTWKLYSLGDVPEIVEEDGLRIRRIPGTDTFGFELAYYAQLGCDAPGRNAHVIMPT